MFFPPRRPPFPGKRRCSPPSSYNQTGDAPGERPPPTRARGVSFPRLSVALGLLTTGR
jgi:hypothetical protein